MFHVFEYDKAVQAAGILLRAHRGKQMSSLRLLTLLYLADRENLKSVARPIIGNHFVATEDGPQHREVRELLTSIPGEELSWSTYIHRDGYVVELVEDPGALALSPQEIEVLTTLADRYRARNDVELVELTRQFPEWQRNHVVNSSVAISITDVLDALGWSAEDRASILEEFDDEERLERLLDRNPAAAGP